MLERSVYNWAFGVRFTLDGLYIKPCLSKQYENSKITLKYLDKNLKIKYNGYGNKVQSAGVNGKAVTVSGGALALRNSQITGDAEIILNLKA